MCDPATGQSDRPDRDGRTSTDGGRKLTIIETRTEECGTADVFIGP